MSSVDRMFRVIVAGGVALTAAGSGVIAGCGGSATTSIGDSGFPQEGNAPVDGFPQETGYAPDGFPSETATQLDANVIEAGDAGGHDADADAFPQEGPNLEAGFFDVGHAEASADASGLPDGFPFETASP
jgi:hypothetical protein